MFPSGVLYATLVIFEVAYSLPLEEIEPVELFHHCIEVERDENEPEKSPVLLLHSLLLSHRSYEGIDQLIANRTKRRVCSVDLRNHGESPWNNRSDIAAFAVDIGHFLDQQNITKVNFIGESMGGKVAIHYTLNNPDRVNSIIVEDVRPNTVSRAGYLSLKFLIRLIQPFLDSQPENLTWKEFSDWAFQRLDKLIQADENAKIPEDFGKIFDLGFIDGKWRFKHNMALLHENINKPEEIWTKSSGVYTGPTLFMYGTQSLFKVANDKANILKLFPNAKLVPFEGANHVIHQLYREFDDIVVKFLNELQ